MLLAEHTNKKLDWDLMKSWLSGKRLLGLENPSLARLGLKQQNFLSVCWSCAQDWSCWCLFPCQGQHFPSPARGGWVEELLLASSGAKTQERSLRLGGEDSAEAEWFSRGKTAISRGKNLGLD